MTALNAYLLFAIAFAIFALWVVREANAARRRLRKENEEDNVPSACGKCCEAEAEQ